MEFGSEKKIRIRISPEGLKSAEKNQQSDFERFSLPSSSVLRAKTELILRQAQDDGGEKP
jgi:hypothetical protein